MFGCDVICDSLHEVIVGGHVGENRNSTQRRTDSLLNSRLLDSTAVTLNSAVMRLLVPAKINLHLRVGPRRADGFHSLLSWMTTVGLFDNLILEKQSPAEGQSFRMEGAGSGTVADDASRGEKPVAPIALVCDMPGLPCDERNLVVKIALALRDELQSTGGGLRIIGSKGDVPHSAGRASKSGNVVGVGATLHKRIPIGAGLGGGSSDAARTLLGLNQLWEACGSADVLSAFAARFGSDLSFFFHGPSSVCRGRGELVMPIQRPRPRWAVLILPRLSMPTADVYRRFDQMGLGRDEDLTNEPDWQEWTSLNSEQLLPRLVNDLEPPAFDIAPQLGELRRRVEGLLNQPVRMSGSGSSLFTLFDDEITAKHASERIESHMNEKSPAVELAPILRDDLHEDVTNRH
jgi:4-diphosphocytidyl-2-C-methyl-D-erythritol kinase